MAVAVVNKSSRRKIPLPELKRKAERILRLLKQDRVELSLALVGNREMTKLNIRYRKRRGPTDVLSFPGEKDSPLGERLLGDVVISLDQARKQAREKGETLEQEVETLLIHGILHLLGYDHERSAKEAARMRRLEEKVSKALCGTRGLRV